MQYYLLKLKLQISKNKNPYLSKANIKKLIKYLNI